MFFSFFLFLFFFLFFLPSWNVFLVFFILLSNLTKPIDTYSTSTVPYTLKFPPRLSTNTLPRLQHRCIYFIRFSFYTCFFCNFFCFLHFPSGKFKPGDIWCDQNISDVIWKRNQNCLEVYTSESKISNWICIKMTNIVNTNDNGTHDDKT